MVELIVNISNKRIVNMSDLKSAFNNLKDGRHLITIKDFRKRSIPQNSYYWGVVVPMVRRGLYDAGYDAVRTNDEAHAVLKHVFLRKEIVSKETGDMIEMSGSTTALTIPEFNDFLESVCRWASEYLGIIIPDPNEVIIDFSESVEEIVRNAEYQSKIDS